MTGAATQTFGAETRTSQLDEAIRGLQQFLMSKQDPQGFWECELVVDSTVVSDYVLYYHWTGLPEKAQNERCRKHLLTRQLKDGGWPQYPGGPAEVNATIKAYHALRLTGMDKNAPELRKARDRALELGGIPKMHTYGKHYLACLGLFPWKYLPIIPVETMLLPNWFPFNLYVMSSWTRNLFVPLAVINAYKPVRVLPQCPSLDELYPNGTQDGDWSLPRDPEFITWRNFFLTADKCAKALNHLPRGFVRNRALEKAKEWMFERIGPGSDGMGAIFPGMLNTLMALELMGVPRDHPLFAKEEQDFLDLVVGDPDDIRVAPCFSPVWDTAIIAQALHESGFPKDDARLVRSADWLLDKEIKIRGDWKENNPYPIASGWAFEFENQYYPDVDDTFQVILGLRGLQASDEERRQQAIKRGMDWARSFQCKEGGFAAFDKDITKFWLEKVPFADHNAILDPPCSDITGRGLEVMGALGYRKDDPIIARCVEYLKGTQEPDGSWWGRWGVNYVYGTSYVIRGLAAIGEDLNQPHILRARDWLERYQAKDGGWAESLLTYHDPSTRGTGDESTASQTAWALLALLEWGDPKRPSIERGVKYLLETQKADGSFYEWPYTGTGFPKIFYLKYTSYQWGWPLLALARYKRLISGGKIHERQTAGAAR